MWQMRKMGRKHKHGFHQGNEQAADGRNGNDGDEFAHHALDKGQGGVGQDAGDDRGHDRQAHLGYGREVAEQAFLARLVIVGRYLERRICAGLPGVAGQFQRFRRRVRAGTGDHPGPAAARLERRLNDLVMLIGFYLIIGIFGLHQ